MQDIVTKRNYNRTTHKNLEIMKNIEPITIEKLFHFHLDDGYGGKDTLTAILKNGAIRYSYYGGSGSSGIPFSLNNISFYDLVDGNIHWKKNRSLPVENLDNESKSQFKERVKEMLNKSTSKVINEVNINVKFK